MNKKVCKKLDALIKDEIKASKEYKSYGFKGLSKDESRHSKFLKKVKEKC